ncbi:hypothetical protein COCON_G00150840 [Conger conger]|uniref:Uncharacterized protein n=1 Tax=Conger conger TaxID=82655 RepID=A0A9Q1HWI7_CONCO|nr:hypothetical protein COCON_G00150840 [Conger conger]
MDEGSESLVNLLGKRPGKSRRMGSSRRHQRGAGNPEGIERLVEGDNLSNAGQEKGAGAGEAPPQNYAEHQSELLLPSMEIDIQQSQVQTECKTESESPVSRAHRHESESVEKSGRSVDLEDPAQKSEEGDMSNVEDHSSEEVSKGEVLFSLANENGQEEIKENKEREEERNPEKGQTVVSDGHSPTILEQSHNSTAAEQVETAKLQDTQLPLIMENTPIRCEGEISVQEGGKLGKTDQRGAETDTTDKSADIMVYEDTTLPQETSLPVPNKRERRIKLGSTRKRSRKAEVQIETGLEEDAMGQEIEKGEEPSLLEEPLGFEPAAPLGEIQAEEQKEKSIHYATDHEKGMECQVGDREDSDISTHKPEASDHSQLVEPSTFVKDWEIDTDTQLTLWSRESVEHSVAENTKHENLVEDTVILDQLNQSEDSLLPDKGSALSLNFNDLEQRSVDLEDPAQKSEEGDMSNVEDHSSEEVCKGEVLFSLDEENGHEKIKENKEREEERNPEKGQTVVSDGHSPTILEQSHNSTAAEQVETAKLQDTQLPLIMENMPIRCEGEISVQEGGKLGKTDQRGAETDTTDKSADIMVYEDTTLPQETSLPVPNKRERRIKLGSTRKCSHKAEVQIETGVEEDAMGQEIEEGEEPSLLEEPLGFEPAAPLGEIQAEKQKGKSIHYATDQKNRMECQVGDKEDSDISTHKPEASDHSQQAEPSTFLWGWIGR